SVRSAVCCRPHQTQANASLAGAAIDALGGFRTDVRMVTVAPVPLKETTEGVKYMKRGLALISAVLAALAVIAAAGAKSNDTTISGAGSTFVSPLVSTWTPALGQAFGYNLQYSPVGSGAGIAAISNRQVDFGASDAPLTPDQATGCNGSVERPG